MLIRQRVVLSTLLLLSSEMIMARQPASQLINLQGFNANIYTIFSTGIDFIRTNGNQRVSLSSPSYDDYTGHESYENSGSLGVGFGLERELSRQWIGQLGLSGYFNTAVTASGCIWQFGLPDFENYTYLYHIQSSRVVATGKLLSRSQQKYHPYLSGELGASFNRAFGYRETPLIVQAVSMYPFTNNTETSVSWGIGVGVDMDVSTGLRLGIGYQFSDLGKASLGLSSAQETQDALNINHLYDNQVRIQLTVLI